MKKILSVLLASMMICSLCACGETTQSSTGATSENSNAITAPPTSEVKEDDGKVRLRQTFLNGLITLNMTLKKMCL